MSASGNVEIRCRACGRETFAVRKPVYEGFRKVGEVYACAACGQEYASEADVPFVTRDEKPLFQKEELPASPQIFRSDEAARLCRRCAHYVVHPFVQWCALHKKEVEATDSCNRFEARSRADGS